VRNQDARGRIPHELPLVWDMRLGAFGRLFAFDASIGSTRKFSRERALFLT